MKLTDEQREAMEAAWNIYRNRTGLAKIIPDEGLTRRAFEAGYAAAKNETCEWGKVWEGEREFWQTKCDDAMFSLSDDGVGDRDGYTFCPDCGRKIQVVERGKTGE